MASYKVVIGKHMFEDQLPENLPEKLYDWWFEMSFVPDGVGCRMGPLMTETTEEDG